MKKGFYKKIKTDRGMMRIFCKICEHCGTEFTYSEARRNVYACKYCASCSKEIKRENNRERQRRYKERQRALSL